MERLRKVVVGLMVVMFCCGVIASGAMAGKSSSLEGKVVDSKGRPLANQKIIAKQNQPLKGYEQIETTTGSDGSFTLKGFFPNAQYTILLSPNSPKWDSTPFALMQFSSAPEGQTSLLSKPIVVRAMRAKSGAYINFSTGLEWYRGPDQETSWDKAKEWASTLKVDGGGWRMPTTKEFKEQSNSSFAQGDIDRELSLGRMFAQPIEDDKPQIKYYFEGSGGGWRVESCDRSIVIKGCRAMAVRPIK